MNDKGVKRLLYDSHFIAERRYRGDTYACDVLLDLHQAIGEAGLTPRQKAAMYNVYGADMLHEDSAAEMGVSRAAVTQLVDGACRRIAGVYQRWDDAERQGTTILYRSSRRQRSVEP